MSNGVFARAATGGAVARNGFEYQDAFVLQHLPQWLAQEAFSHVVSETRGDVEVCYYGGPGHVLRTLLEAKNHELSAAAFWSELRDFKTIHTESESEYVRFGLVCRDYSSTVRPLLNMLERLRGVVTSHPETSPVVEDARRQVREWMGAKGQADIADFVMERVDFIAFSDEAAEAAFAGEFDAHFRTLDLRSTERDSVKGSFKALIAQSSLKPVLRADLEDAIARASTTAAEALRETPRRLHLANSTWTELALPLGRFDGNDRASLSPSDWAELSSLAEGLVTFIKESSKRRQLLVDGKHRMSSSCLVGFIFSAVRGFHLQVEHNGFVYRTDEHTRAEGDFFISTRFQGEGNSEGVVTIGFPTAVGNDVSMTFLAHLPRLDLQSSGVIDGMPAVNSAVAQAKEEMARFRSQSGISKLHLFVKAPSVFAMHLGYRLNGLSNVQLYDWVEAKYVPTATLS